MRLDQRITEKLVAMAIQDAFRAAQRETLTEGEFWLQVARAAISKVVACDMAKADTEAAVWAGF